MTISLLTALHILRGQIENGDYPRYGICKAVDTIVDEPFIEYDRDLQLLWVDWPQYSGDKQYPIPDPYGDQPESFFGYLCDENRLWQDDQLVLRTSLVDFCINKLENQ